MDMHDIVEGEISILEGRQIRNVVKNHLLESKLRIIDVIILVESNEF